MPLDWSKKLATSKYCNQLGIITQNSAQIDWTIQNSSMKKRLLSCLLRPYVLKAKHFSTQVVKYCAFWWVGSALEISITSSAAPLEILYIPNCMVNNWKSKYHS